MNVFSRYKMKNKSVVFIGDLYYVKDAFIAGFNKFHILIDESFDKEITNIDNCDITGYHYLNGLIEFLNEDTTKKLVFLNWDNHEEFINNSVLHGYKYKNSIFIIQSQKISKTKWNRLNDYMFMEDNDTSYIILIPLNMQNLIKYIK